MSNPKTCRTCGHDGIRCAYWQEKNFCRMTNKHIHDETGECGIHFAVRMQRERADDAECRLREALARLALREALIETLMHSGEVMAERNMQLEVALLRDEGSA